MKSLLRNLTAKTFNQRFPVGSSFLYHPTPGMPERETVNPLRSLAYAQWSSGCQG
ncbi:hypothetical protein [Enterobacter asburiae]|uniref:hypothetical protein n=1 Tax=Enterobacter asburiae TaxID=61645 RepID=UPI0013DD9B15|nr:hypothetical protein [Enterobacter asburiae]